MANNYTSASFLIPCNAEQAAMVETAINFITEGSVKEGNALLEKSPESLTLLEKLIARIVLEHPEVHSQKPSFSQPDCPDENLLMELATEITPNGLAVFHEESIDVDVAIGLTHAVLAVFELPDMVEISAAFTCDKPRLDEFGGIIVLVTARGYQYLDRYRFTQTMHKAHQDGLKYALCSIVHHNGSEKIEASYLMACKSTDDARAVALSKLGSLPDVIQLNGYFSQPTKGKGVYLKLDKVTELTAFEFDGIRRILPSIDAL
ncbi:hypothetical protein I7V28_19215 [Lelliottia amnigena]|uniref:hypothetical protein n=1 Tax=Lelliottia TaxID=1330545 RepID=UPI00192B0DA1|nr:MULTISPECIES: hypothetical protein [Lelliottia]MBL5885635.1 hypothetical protein [Lelliottia aquatilis]MBL5923213.1 hypothetical protein [Lelliottia amnigena]MBL5932123.1 hypothetical protein [Lelliottia amnigena]